MSQGSSLSIDGGPDIKGAIVGVEKTSMIKINCSFCGRDSKNVKKVIAGPVVYICNVCVGLCVKVLAEEGTDYLEKTNDDS